MVVLALALLAGQTASAVAQPATSAPAAVEEADGGAPPEGEAPKEPTTQQPGKAAGKKPGGMFDSMTLMIVMLGGFFLLYIWMGRSRRKQRRQRQEMLTALKKGDKITSIGGIVGTVIEVRDDEVTVKVDETGNVRMKFARWAIRGVGEAGKAEDPAQAEKKP
jgi:preprotein translocase subunit YajC